MQLRPPRLQAKANPAAAEARARCRRCGEGFALQVEQEVARLNESLQNYKLVSTEQVFFGVSQSASIGRGRRFPGRRQQIE